MQYNIKTHIFHLLSRGWIHAGCLINYIFWRYEHQAMSPANVILVCGSGRSGTTWLGSVVAEIMEAQIIFEPMLLNTDVEFALRKPFFDRGRIDFNLQLYATRDDLASIEKLRGLEELFFGACNTYWTRQACNRNKASWRVIKEIRACLALEGICNLWPELKVIYLVRNPIDVIQSQILASSKGWEFDCDIRQLKYHNPMLWTRLKDFEPFLQSSSSLSDRLALRWCIENWIAHTDAVHFPNVRCVSYSDCLSMSVVWREILTWLNIESSSTKAVNLTKRARTDLPFARRTQLTHFQLHYITEVTEAFGLSKYLG
ncbi:hypothetical protein VN12_08480 [Pirellula sp. SH-Sr6A]|uniref:sulfotransferase n=1 Tax=Pirellula sp. SH-Sr6A TaxID=1632865 RepID=UPI00078BB566|nr:hypothetical protein VN12_08480 [Pirellula sp. SH-Sr6A]